MTFHYGIYGIHGVALVELINYPPDLSRLILTTLRFRGVNALPFTPFVLWSACLI